MESIQHNSNIIFPKPDPGSEFRSKRDESQLIGSGAERNAYPS